MRLPRFLRRKTTPKGHKHGWIVLGILEGWESDGKPSFRRLAAKCATCPQATPNLFQWVDGKQREGVSDFWYGTPLGQPIGEGVETGEPIVQPYDDADLPRKPEGEAKWEGFMDT